MASAPTATKLTSTPAVYQSARRRASPPSRPLSASDSAFSDRIGNTHGIRLRIRPPVSASASATSSEEVPRGLRASTSSGGRVRSTSVAMEAADVVVSGVASTGVVAVGGGATVAGAGVSGVLAGVTVPDGIASFTRRVIGG